MRPQSARQTRGSAPRESSFSGEIAVYAPTALTEDADELLDSLGPYVARRRPVARALPGDTPTDAAATGRAREVLLSASGDFGLVGTPKEVKKQVETLREAGADTVVGYPARGIESFLD